MLPANPQTEVGVPTYALHRSPGIWSAPDAFLPERWLTATPEGAFIPFLLGPYACIGKSLAWMEMRVVSANLLREFHLLPLADKLPVTCDPTLRPKRQQYFVHVSPRQ